MTGRALRMGRDLCEAIKSAVRLLNGVTQD